MHEHVRQAGINASLAAVGTSPLWMPHDFATWVATVAGLLAIFAQLLRTPAALRDFRDWLNKRRVK